MTKRTKKQSKDDQEDNGNDTFDIGDDLPIEMLEKNQEDLPDPIQHKKTTDEKEDEINATPVKRRETHKSYTVAFKLEVIAFANSASKEAAARKYGVAPKRIREWVKQKDQLVEFLERPGGKRRKKLDGAGRKPMSTTLEEKLLEWITEMREKRNRVSRKMVRNKAREMCRQDPILRVDVEARGTEFLASNGWLNRFFRRNNLTLRCKPTQGQKIPLQYVPKLKNFIFYIRSLRLKNYYAMGDIFAMDETAVWLDMPGSTTVSSKGEKSVPVSTTGHDKSQVTVCLTAKANGVKLPPMVVFKGRRLEREVENLPGIIPVMSDNGWMSEDLTLRYLNSVLGRMSFNRRLLVWDSHCCHISEAVKNEAKKMKVDVAVIPGGCTAIIQAPDVCWNAPFKAYFRELYEEWMNTENKPLTAGGNLKPPSKLQIAQWVKAAWARLSTEMIIGSFFTCAISNNVDGSQDDFIECMKEDGCLFAHREDIAEKSKVLVASNGNLDALSGPAAAWDIDTEGSDGDSDHDEVIMD